MRKHADDANFVLARFSLAEQNALDEKILPKTLELIEKFYRSIRIICTEI